MTGTYTPGKIPASEIDLYYRIRPAFISRKFGSL